MEEKMEIKRYPGGLELHEERALDRISRAFVQTGSGNAEQQNIRYSGNSLATALQAAGVSNMFPWKGYAGFRFAGKNKKGKDYEGEYDLVIITHHNILVIELKDWYGQVTFADGHWYQNGSERENAYITTQRKKFFLENKLVRPENSRHFLW
ncbi:nuclease-related domain-containing protein [Methylophaga frappieri]|uniref:nuclease-related domain-containing protein n=1 Tax=Methylophaga frappieri (strain ATCC BAA-2434 / DSM 25690 / JAM7) TaxID=754477 RepID=UPI00059EB233|nr:nuclease-related domain-containing protein [Methylophaga frappieri]